MLSSSKSIYCAKKAPLNDQSFKFLRHRSNSLLHQSQNYYCMLATKLETFWRKKSRKKFFLLSYVALYTRYQKAKMNTKIGVGGMRMRNHDKHHLFFITKCISENTLQVEK